MNPDRQQDPAPTGPVGQRFFTRPSWTEVRFVTDALRTETIGGMLLLVAAALALIWACLLYTSRCV